MDTDSPLSEEGRFIAKMIQDVVIINTVSRTFVDARSAALLELVHSTLRASTHDASPPNFANLKRSVVNRTRELANQKLASLADDHMAQASFVFQVLDAMLEEENQQSEQAAPCNPLQRLSQFGAQRGRVHALYVRENNKITRHRRDKFNTDR